MQQPLKTRVFKGIIWSCVERFSVQGIMFLLQIIMARILTPADYGVIGMLTIFIAVAQSFVDSGFSNALIQKYNRDETDYSTVFYFNLVVGLFFYLLLFWAAPFIASFYRIPVLTDLTRIVALSILFNSLIVVQRTKLSIAIDFKLQSKISLLAVILSGIIGIVMAYRGYGVWSIAFQTVTNAGFNMLFLCFFCRWKPRGVFSWTSFRSLFSFGSKLLFSGLLNTLYNNIFTIIIGKKYSKADLGNYTRADQFCQFPSSNLTSIIQRVTFPVLSELQNDDERLSTAYRRFLRLSVFIVFPLMVGLAALTKPFILLVLTEKWSGVILLMQLLCFSYIWYPVHMINLNLLQVKGRSDLFLRLEVIKKVVGGIIIAFTVPFGVVAMCIGTIFTGVLSLAINAYYTGKLIQLGFIKQMLDIVPILVNSLAMGAVIYGIISLIDSQIGQLVVGILCGILYYFLSNYLLRSNDLRYLFSLVKSK